MCICGGLENNIHKICIYNIIILQYVTWNAWYVTYNMWSYNSSLFLRRWSGVCRVSPMSGQNNVVMWLVFGLNFCTFPKDMLSINVSTYAHHINRSHSKSAACLRHRPNHTFWIKASATINHHQPSSNIINDHQPSLTIINLTQFHFQIYLFPWPKAKQSKTTPKTPRARRSSRTSYSDATDHFISGWIRTRSMKL